MTKHERQILRDAIMTVARRDEITTAYDLFHEFTTGKSHPLSFYKNGVDLPFKLNTSSAIRTALKSLVDDGLLWPIASSKGTIYKPLA